MYVFLYVLPFSYHNRRILEDLLGEQWQSSYCIQTDGVSGRRELSASWRMKWTCAPTHTHRIRCNHTPTHKMHWSTLEHFHYSTIVFTSKHNELGAEVNRFAYSNQVVLFDNSVLSWSHVFSIALDQGTATKVIFLLGLSSNRTVLKRKNNLWALLCFADLEISVSSTVIFFPGLFVGKVRLSLFNHDGCHCSTSASSPPVLQLDFF